jgi:hypothetical protein
MSASSARLRPNHAARRARSGARHEPPAFAEGLEVRRLLAIANGSFESGYAGWTPSSPLAGIMTTYFADDLTGQTTTYTPRDGNFMSVLFPRANTPVTITSQPFAANAGDVASGWAFFDAYEFLPYNDQGYVAIKSAATGATLAQPFRASVRSVGDYGQTPWTQWHYTFPAAGTYQIEAGVRNVGQTDFPSNLGLDAITVSPRSGPPNRAPQITSAAVAEPAQEGSRSVLHVDFADADLSAGDTHRLDVNWGDGTTSSALPVDADQFPLYGGAYNPANGHS